MSPLRPAARRRFIQLAAMIGAGPLLGAGCATAVDALPRPASGRIERWARHASRHVEARHVDVWLPPGYDERARQGRRHAVLYMHDGQMLFDPATTWNRQAWRIDVAATALMASGAVEPFIVVAPWNAGPLRHSEFFPSAMLPRLPEALRERFVTEALAGRSRGDDYLRFLVEELKPAVDARYSTRPGRDANWLMGSSMGGLVSIAALWAHPQVFGGAAGLSTHWIGSFGKNPEFPRAAVAWLRESPPAPGSVRLWTDRGSLELDALYVDAHREVVEALRGLGFAPPDFRAEVFEGTGHNETDWSRRVQAPLAFLLGR